MIAGEAPKTAFGDTAWAVVLLAGLFFFNICSRIVLSPLMPAIEADLQISHAAAGSLFFLISVGYFAALLGSGYVAARLLHRSTIIVSALGVGLALLGISFTQSLGTLRLSLVILGAAAGLYLPSAIAALTSIVRPQNWGKAIAVHELAPSLAFIVVPFAAELILGRFSWQAVHAVFGVSAVLLGLFFARFGSGGRFVGRPPGVESIKVFLSDLNFWIMTFLFGLGISGTLGVYTMLPLYLVADCGMIRSDANMLLSLSRVSGLFMALIGGWASDRFGAFKTMVVVFLVSGLATIGIGMAPGRWALAAVFVQPMAAVCFFPAGFAALSAIGPSDSRNIAVSLAIPFAFLVGGGIVPALIGFFGDAGSFPHGIALVGVMIGSGALWAGLLQYRSRRSE
ncbi:MAG: MFS transporter [Desulfobacterales bacterium]|nr:MFS transporter [Desulfobacterales bacterium]